MTPCSYSVFQLVSIYLVQDLFNLSRGIGPGESLEFGVSLVYIASSRPAGLHSVSTLSHLEKVFLCVCMSVCGFVQVDANCLWRSERHWILLYLEFWAVLNHLNLGLYRSRAVSSAKCFSVFDSSVNHLCLWVFLNVDFPLSYLFKVFGVL